MSQRLVIRLIPLEIFFFSLGAGWMLMNGMSTIFQATPGMASAGALSPVFTPEVQHWAGKINDWAAPYQLDPNLVATVMQIESWGAPHAVSSSGAQGLFQVMPFHFAPEDVMEAPDTNAGRGLAYLSLGLSRSGGNVGLALAGYNGGHGMIGRDSSLWPTETQRYWYWGTGIYQDAVNGLTDSPRLQEWLHAGGASLCARAAQELGVAR